MSTIITYVAMLGREIQTNDESVSPTKVYINYPQRSGLVDR